MFRSRTRESDEHRSDAAFAAAVLIALIVMAFAIAPEHGATASPRPDGGSHSAPGSDAPSSYFPSQFPPPEGEPAEPIATF